MERTSRHVANGPRPDPDTREVVAVSNLMVGQVRAKRILESLIGSRSRCAALAQRIEQRDEGRRNGKTERVREAFSIERRRRQAPAAECNHVQRGAQAVLLKLNNVARIERLIDNLLGSRFREIRVVRETMGPE